MGEAPRGEEYFQTSSSLCRFLSRFSLLAMYLLSLQVSASFFNKKKFAALSNLLPCFLFFAMAISITGTLERRDTLSSHHERESDCFSK